MKSNKTRLSGAVLATAAAFAFLSSAAFAADAPKGDSGKGSVKCVGGNSCSGHSECASAGSSCKGQNSCKGKGFVTTATEKECTALGGAPETMAPAKKM
ncbi:MAG: BufA2 family periplasmic bufferin-type metallophore [Candidatus Binataceae bacterium]